MMNGLLKVAMTSLAAAKVKRSIGRAAVQAALLACVCLIAIVGLGFLLSALWLYVAFAYSPLVASLAIGGGLLVVAIALYLLASYLRHRGAVEDVPLVPGKALAQLMSPETQRGALLTTAIFVAGIGYVFGRIVARK